GPEIVNELVESDNINYPVLMANSDVVNGFGGVKGIPTSFLVSYEGKMVQTYTGYVSHELLRQDIEEIISKKPKRTQVTTRVQVKKKAEKKKKDVKTKKSVIHIDKRLRTVYSSD
ncbi:hypothetical protein VU04_06310, partial [Desulfobulbus sp. TB]|nr:hypothetical protein [Desulfobulbus sp. TB]